MSDKTLRVGFLAVVVFDVAALVFLAYNGVTEVKATAPSEFSIWRKSFITNGQPLDHAVMKHHPTQSCWVQFESSGIYANRIWTPVPTALCD